jgi:hypothetical protein
LYDEQERSLQRQNIELNDRVKRFEQQLEVIKHDQSVERKKKFFIRIFFYYIYLFRKIMIKN